MRGESQRVADRVRELLDPERVAAAADAQERRVAWFDDAESAAGCGDVSDGAAASGPDDPEPTRERVAGRAHVAPPWHRRLAARVPVRVDPGHRAALGVGVAVLVVAIVAGAWLWLSGPRAADVTAAPTPLSGAASPTGSAVPLPAGTLPSTASAPSTVSGEVVVDVAGKVAHPGVYRLPTGSRVADALAAAGGARAGVDLTPINLAATVADGQQIVVGAPAAAGQPGASSGGAAVPTPAAGGSGPASGSGALVNINTAGLDQLEALPGIGPALGQRILDYRTEHGPFTGVDQLNDVSGIGDVKFADLKALVTV